MVHSNVNPDDLPQTARTRHHQAVSERPIPPEMLALHKATLREQINAHEEITIAMRIAAPNMKASLAEPGPKKIQALQELITHLDGLKAFAQAQLDTELAAHSKP